MRAGRSAWVGLALAALLAPCGPARAAFVAEPPAATPAAAHPDRSDTTIDKLDSLTYLGRAQPDVASAELVRYVDTLRVDDPRYLQALMEIGSEYVFLSRGDDVERIAHRIETLSERDPLARPAAMVLRGQWLQQHGEVSKAERQLIEAGALMPADPPAFLKLRLLVVSAIVKRRGGHYDEAMARFDAALKMVDASGPVWQRIDIRREVADMLDEAGQPDKAAEFVREEMQLAVQAGDEYGMSRAYTLRFILADHAGVVGPALLSDERAALEHARLSGNKQFIVLGMANLADYYLSHGDYQTAYDMSQEALPLAREINSDAVESVALANTGLALIGLKRKDEGIPLVHESMSLDERVGSARSIADEAYELGSYLERAGYLADAFAAYRQYRQLSDDLNQQDRQRSLIELQENFANERRQHELDMLAREGRLKDEELRRHGLQVKLWTAAGLSGLLLTAVLMGLARRLRVRNAQLSVSNEQLRQQAEVDPLTGLSNRHHLQTVMARRAHRALDGTLYLIDVDHFKRINDRCGHAGGDAVLVEIARRLRNTLRDDDLIVRWGGEEFLVLVRPLPTAEADALGHRLLCALADAPVFHDGKAVPVSASIGFARFPVATPAPRREIEIDWERAIALVDAAMYLAKAHGRNGACCIRGLVAADAAALEAVMQSLETAWEDGRAELRLQAGPALREAVS